MTISSLSSGNIVTPNHYNGRAYPVTKVTIHEMAAVWTAQRCGEFFRDSTRNASSNYGIGNDGDIKCYVDEDNAAWTSANWDNDNRAITIEVSNCVMGGDWPISNAAYDSLVKLCADICTRYGIEPRYTGSPYASFTEHKMFANTACPGPYIHNLLASGKLIEDVKNAMAGQWIKDDKGWWYRRTDGSWPKSQWEQIKGKWYYFGEDGYMKTGWVFHKGYWFYLDETDGYMHTGWVKWKDKKGVENWYYLDDNGAMYKSIFLSINGKWYAFDEGGRMVEKAEELKVGKDGDITIT